MDDAAKAAALEGAISYAAGVPFHQCPLDDLFAKENWQKGWEYARKQWQKRLSAALGQEITLPPRM